MNRAMFLADVHLGNHTAHGGPTVVGMNHRCRVGLDTLDRALKSELEGSVFVLGDLFDTARPLPQLITEVQHVLAEADRDVWLLKGNHDSNSVMPGDHALGPLVRENPAFGSQVIVVTAPMVVASVVGLIPFRPEPVLTWLERDAQYLAGQGAQVLGVHFGLHDAAMRAQNPWMADCTDAAPVEAIGEILDKLGLEWLFAGNWHSFREFEPYRCTQVGALMPTGWDNEGEGPFGLVTVDTAGRSYIEVPGPRFFKVRDLVGLNRAAQSATNGNRVYVRAEVPSADVPAWLAKLKDVGLFEGYEVLVDRDQVREVALAAADRARKLDSLGNVVGEYVSGLELPAGVRRGEVLRRTREYLNVSG